MYQELNKQNFSEKVLNSDRPAIVDFWASWCGPCVMMAPLFESLSESYDGKVDFYKVNVDDNPELAQSMQVMSIPTFMLFKNGQPVQRVVGTRSEDQLSTELDALLV